MKKRILIGLTIILLLFISFVFYRTRPSGDIDNYKEYYVNDIGQPKNGEVKVTFFGVSTLLFDDGQTQLLIDGFFSRPPLWRALLTKIKSDTALIDDIVTTYKMDRVKGVFVTHSHYDHALDAAYIAKRTGARLYGSVSTLNIGRGGGLKEEQLSLFQPHQELQFGDFTVQVVSSKHSPGNALKDDGVVIDKPLNQPAKVKAYSEGGSYDFYIRHKGNSIYVKPSPNYLEGALDSLKADVLFMGIATVAKKEQAWQDKFYQQTVGTLKPALLIPLHWDDFLHPVSKTLVMLPRFANDTPKDFDLFIKKTKADHIDFKILQGSGSIVLFK